MRFLMLVCQDDQLAPPEAEPADGEVERWVTAMDSSGVRVTADPDCVLEIRPSSRAKARDHTTPIRAARGTAPRVRVEVESSTTRNLRRSRQTPMSGPAATVSLGDRRLRLLLAEVVLVSP